LNSYVQRLSAAGRQAVQARNWPQVRALAREILNRDKSSAEGRFLLGLAEKAADRRDQAIEAFARALELDAVRYDAAVELAGQYVRRHRYGEAASLLARAEPLMQNSPLYLDMAGTIYGKIGLPSRALGLHRRANELQPGVDVLRANLAACEVFVGNIEKAREIYLELLAKHPHHQRNHYELSRLGRAKDARHVEEMQVVLREAGLPPERNIYLYYALGKELEDLERWEEAFDYYKKAGDAARSVANYDVGDDVAIINRVIEVCDSDWLAKDVPGRTSGAGGKTPIFVVGLPRSGTTLTERILSSHSQVGSAGESFFLQIALKQLSGIRSHDDMNPDMVSAAAGKDISKLADAYLEAIDYRLGDEPYFIEKLPENVLYLGFIARAFPDARLVLLKRNPMDVCFALYKQSYFRYAYDFDDLGRYYVAYNELYGHWREVLGDRLVEIEYEALVSDPETETRNLLDRVGLDFEEACLHFERNKAASNTASTVQIREKAHTRSVLRWQRYEEQLRPLRELLEAAGIKVV
jgi:tetratricopeptide (TPR) repeat protein